MDIIKIFTFKDLDGLKGRRKSLIIFAFENFKILVEFILEWLYLVTKLTNCVIDKPNWQTYKFSKEQSVKELELVGTEFGSNIDKISLGS